MNFSSSAGYLKTLMTHIHVDKTGLRNTGLSFGAYQEFPPLDNNVLGITMKLAEEGIYFIGLGQYTYLRYYRYYQDTY